MFIGRSSATACTLSAAFWGFGILFTLSGRPFRYYYLLVSMPLMFVWTARAALNVDRIPGRPLSPRRDLLLLCAAEGLLSFAFLNYVHVNQRRIGGDYGIPYRAQAPHAPIGATSRHMRASSGSFSPAPQAPPAGHRAGVSQPDLDTTR